MKGRALIDAKQTGESLRNAVPGVGIALGARNSLAHNSFHSDSPDACQTANGLQGSAAHLGVGVRRKLFETLKRLVFAAGQVWPRRGRAGSHDRVFRFARPPEKLWLTRRAQERGADSSYVRVFIGQEACEKPGSSGAVARLEGQPWKASEAKARVRAAGESAQKGARLRRGPGHAPKSLRRSPPVLLVGREDLSSAPLEVGSLGRHGTSHAPRLDIRLYIYSDPLPGSSIEACILSLRCRPRTHEGCGYIFSGIDGQSVAAGFTPARTHAVNVFPEAE